MEPRKVQQLGPSTLAVSLPASWVQEWGVRKGHVVQLAAGELGALTVFPPTAGKGPRAHQEVVIHADRMTAPHLLERAIIGSYALGRSTLRVTSKTGVKDRHLEEIRSAEEQLLGLGVVEETPTSVVIRCSVNPSDFNLDDLIQRLHVTARTMRAEAMESLTLRSGALARRARTREKQANRIFVLLLRLILSAQQNPQLVPDLGLSRALPLVGYRAVAKSLELMADEADALAGTILALLEEDPPAPRVLKEIEALHADVASLCDDTVEALIKRDFDVSCGVAARYKAAADRDAKVLASLVKEDGPARRLLLTRSVASGLLHIAAQAQQIAEVGANRALQRPSDILSFG